MNDRGTSGPQWWRAWTGRRDDMVRRDDLVAEVRPEHPRVAAFVVVAVVVLLTIGLALGSTLR